MPKTAGSEPKLNLRLLLRAVALFIVFSVPSFLCYSLYRQYSQKLTDAETRSANTARTLAQHAARTFETADTYLRAAASLVGPHARGLLPEALHAALREQMARSPLENIVIIDQDGRATIEAVEYPARAFDVRERDYFVTLRDQPNSDLTIGRPITGKLTGKLMLPIARRIDNRDGTFAGVVLATIDPQLFRSVYEAIDNGPGAAVSLWRSDGLLLTRAPWAPDMIGRNYAAGPNYRLHVPIKDERPFWSPATTDGIERAFAFGFLDGYPVYVSAAVSREDALAEWWKSALAQAGVGGGLTVVLAAALLMLAREIERRHNADVQIRASEARLRVSEERLALALDSGEDGIWDWDLVAGSVLISDRWMARLGHPGQKHITMAAVANSVHPDDRQLSANALRDHLRGRTSSFTCEYRIFAEEGEWRWVLTRGRVVEREAEGRALRVVGTLIDISRRKDAEARIEHMALHDALTGLPNRTLFRQHLDLALQRACSSPGRHAVLALDIDRFKAVNDTYGHPAGDRLLCLVAERIRTALCERGTVARLGGDEFAVILTDIGGEAAVKLACERIIAAVDEPLLLDGAALDIGLSVGATLLSGDGMSAEEGFQRADMALFQAKAAGRNTYRLFDPEAHARFSERSLLALEMKEAIRRGDFSLVYQPIVDLTTGAIANFEALMRWQHPIHGLISPNVFIPVAEETGLIIPLGAWALKEGCREALNWPVTVRVSINVSAVQFRGDLEEAVLAALAETGLPAERLRLEVTESLLVQNPDQAISVLHRLRGLGVRIALDDFGTGYSSLSYLRSFPFDTIKIDRAFIRDIADPDAAAIVRAMVGIGDRLGMGIVAEGIETAEQLELVRREGCNEVQGYYFSKPLAADVAKSFSNLPLVIAA